MANPYHEPKHQDYTGEYFTAVYHGYIGEDGNKYTIYQIEPRLWIAQTSSYAVAVELVNRLDVTGEQRFGGGI